MKRFLMQTILPLIMNWFRRRFVRRSTKKIKFGSQKKEKQLSLKHLPPLKIGQFLKTDLRRKT